MQKIINFFKAHKWFLVILLSVPTFWKLLIPGIHSMQDFHLFRLQQFDKCVQNFQIPCRWAPDAGLGYGEPLFNFYGQFAYAVGEIFHLIGFNFINSLKILFILSLVGSGVGMFFLAKRIWKNDFAALVSAVLYLYAPYRAVDVWVRGALPEAFAFIFFPLIILAIERKSFFGFSLLVSGLILTHNLSALMFLPVIAVWIIYRKFWKGISAGFIALVLSAFYLLPLIFESKFVSLGSTTQGYFDFRAHFTTLYQLFFSRFWGYGGSTWGNEDGLSLSIGLAQWVLPAIALIIIFLKKKLKGARTFLLLLGLAFFFLLLTHNKTAFLWEALPFMAYIQFPWRFLAVALFCFSLASGALIGLLGKKETLVSLGVIILAIGLNFSFFREDIWYKVGDSYFFEGEEWVRQRTASIGDFWPIYGRIPTSPPESYFAGWRPSVKKSNFFEYDINAQFSIQPGENMPSLSGFITLPVAYFPGWTATVDELSTSIEPSEEDGNIKLEIPGGEHKVQLKFKDTPVRKIGNILSLVSLALLIWTKKRL